MVESRQTEALVIICLFPVLAALFVIARTWSRWLGRNFGWDDWLIHLSMLLLIGQTVTIYKYVLVSHTGYHGRDIPKQTVDEKILAAKWSFAVQMFYHPMMGAIRASIIQFLFRVKDTRLHIQVALHVVLWINIGYMVSTTFVNIFQCTPIRYVYLRPEMDQIDANGNIIPGGKCIDSLTFIIASCALSIIMDLIIIPIPTAMVWNLQMRAKTKVAVVIIMSMGWLATAVSVVRLVIYYYRFAPTQKDKTWDIGIVTSIVEPSVGVIAACAPAMKCLLRHLMPRYFTEDAPSYPTPTPTYDKSKQRRSFNFRYSANKELSESRVDPVREEELYGMRPLGSIDSREQITSMAAQGPARAHSTKTESTEAGEAEPKHMLNREG